MTKKKGRTCEALGHHLWEFTVRDEKAAYVGDNGERRRERADPLAPACLEQEEEHSHKEHISGRAGIGWKANWIVPEEPVDKSSDDGRRDLADYICRAECDPSIDATWVFARLPQSAVHVELGHDAVHNRGREHYDQENGEHTVLHAGDRVSEHPEGLHTSVSEYREHISVIYLQIR